MSETAFDFGMGLGSSDAPRLAKLREAVVVAIERVGRIIDVETEALRAYRPVDLAAFNHQKSHGLLDLTRALKALPPTAVDQAIVDDLRHLRDKLETNLKVLDIHLKAVRQVSALIARAIEDESSDGTYSMSINEAARYYD